MIPKLIHQTWIGNKIPKACNSYVESVKRNFKGWDYKLWTDSDCENLLNQYYPIIYKKYLNCTNNGEKADLFRYCIMHMYGGFYFDLDYEVFKPFEEIENFNSYKLFLFRETENLFSVFGSRDIIGNSVFGAEKESIFFSKVIGFLQNDILFKITKNSSSATLCKVDTTLFRSGPFLLSKIYELYKKDLNNCFLGESPMFTDYSFKKNAYGVHHCMHTWFKEYE